MKFLQYLEISHLYYYFHEFDIPFNGEAISKKQVLKAIENEVLPSSLTPRVINHIFEDSEELEFPAFASLLFWYGKFSEKTKQYLNVKQFVEIISDEEFPNKNLKNLINDFNEIHKKDIEKASQARMPRQFDEKDYLISFLEKNEKTNKEEEKEEEDKEEDKEKDEEENEEDNKEKDDSKEEEKDDKKPKTESKKISKNKAKILFNLFG